MEEQNLNNDYIRKDIPEDDNRTPTSSLIQLYEMPWREYLKHKNYDTDIKNMCSNCQKEQIRKYGEITIKCSGPKDISVIDPEIIAQLNKEEIEEVKQTISPVYWAEKNIDVLQTDPNKRLYVNRWYQSMQIQCSATKKAIRCGRRSGKSYGLAIDIANRLVQNTNYQILVVTPFLSQAKELTGVVKKILRSLSATIGTWDELVERSVTSPYQEIQMRNGSTFKAFTAGNDNANAVRGQGAHLIIIDEADFLTQEAFDSITAILMDKPNTEIICTSTPMGEGLLYKFSNSKDYKEFHFPSFVIPHYNDDMDKEFRNSLSMMAYIQEICLRENEEVLTECGKKYIQDIKAGDIVFDKNMNPVKVWQSARKTGHKELLKTIINIPDTILHTTSDHKFPNRDNKRTCISELSELEVYRTPYKNNSKDEILARLIGYNLGDGTITSTRFDSYWYSSEREDMLLVSEDIRKLWPNLKASVLEYLVRNSRRENALVKIDAMRYSVSASSEATRYLMSLGMVRGKKVEQEFNVPEFVLSGSESVKIEFIAALFGAEGSTPRVDRNFSIYVKKNWRKWIAIF